MATQYCGPDGSAGIDNAFAQPHGPGIGAEIMGSNKFGPPGWQDDPDWTGWWGENPRFHTPTFVLTHRPHPPIELDGGTTFHFLDTSPTEALAVARKAAGRLDVRIGGGPSMAAPRITSAVTARQTNAVPRRSLRWPQRPRGSRHCRRTAPPNPHTSLLCISHVDRNQCRSERDPEEIVLLGVPHYRASTWVSEPGSRPAARASDGACRRRSAQRPTERAATPSAAMEWASHQ